MARVRTRLAQQVVWSPAAEVLAMLYNINRGKGPARSAKDFYPKGLDEHDTPAPPTGPPVPIEVPFATMRTAVGLGRPRKKKGA